MTNTNDSVFNRAMVHEVNEFDQLRRFLMLGSESSMYTAGKDKTLTVASAPKVSALLQKSGVSVVNELVEVSTSGRAAKQDPTLLVLAMAARSADVEVRKAAFDAIPKICRTPTMLFSFIDFYKAAGSTSGWGRLMRDAVSSWYNNKNLNDLVYQVTKYAQREGWSHRDVLRLSHPKPENDDRSKFYKWIVSKGEHKIDIDAVEDKRAFTRLLAVEAAKLAPDASSIVPLIREFNLVHEHIPTNLQKDPSVWEALLEGMPLTALIRNLGRMTAYGLLTDTSDATKRAVEKLTNKVAIEKARIHPFNVLVALNTYQKGHGNLGSLTWKPVSKISKALNELFYDSFMFVEPSNKRTCVALDVSGSMTWGDVNGSPGINPRLASAAMAMATIRTEPNVTVMGFSHQLVEVDLKKTDTLETVVKKIESVPMGSTMCSLPMVWAAQKKLAFDTFIIYTDNETNSDRMSPAQALREYRQKMGIPARLIVVALAGHGRTIADPNDPGMLDVSGFDSAAPSVIAEFSRGVI